MGCVGPKWAFPLGENPLDPGLFSALSPIDDGKMLDQLLLSLA